MSKIEVKDVVCDYGIYIDDELVFILNSKQIALKIADLLIEDEKTNLFVPFDILGGKQ